MFDCVIPTRYARGGAVFTARGRIRADEPPLPPRRLSDRHLLRLRRLRGRLLARLPAPPVRRERDPLGDPGLDPQRALLRAPGARRARRDRRRPLRRVPARVPGPLPLRQLGLTRRPRSPTFRAPCRCAAASSGFPNVGKSTLFNALTAAGIRRRELPVLHDRAEPRRGGRARSAARGARRHRALGARRAGDRRVRRHRRARRRRLQGRGPRQPVPGPHPRDRRRSSRWCAASRTRTSSTWPGSSIRSRDVATIETELGLADLDTVERRVDRARRAARTGAKEADAEAELLERPASSTSPPASPRAPSRCPKRRRRAFRELHLLTAKPVLYVANVGEDALVAGNEQTRALEQHAKETGAGVIRLCAKVEAELAELAPEDRAPFLADLGLEEPGLDRLIRAAYELLGLITFLTAGPKEVRAWTIRRGALAPQAAGVIHTDFERTLHPRRGDRLRGLRRSGRRGGRARRGQAARSRARNTWCATATSCTSGSAPSRGALLGSRAAHARGGARALQRRPQDGRLHRRLLRGQSRAPAAGASCGSRTIA